MIDFSKEWIEHLEHESELAAEMEKHRRTWILCIILAVSMALMLLASVTYIIVREQQFQQVTIEQEVEQNADNGVNHFIGGDNYGDAAG